MPCRIRCSSSAAVAGAPGAAARAEMDSPNAFCSSGAPCCRSDDARYRMRATCLAVSSLMASWPASLRVPWEALASRVAMSRRSGGSRRRRTSKSGGEQRDGAAWSHPQDASMGAPVDQHHRDQDNHSGTVSRM